MIEQSKEWSCNVLLHLGRNEVGHLLEYVHLITTLHWVQKVFSSEPKIQARGSQIPYLEFPPGSKTNYDDTGKHEIKTEKASLTNSCTS